MMKLIDRARIRQRGTRVTQRGRVLRAAWACVLAATASACVQMPPHPDDAAMAPMYVPTPVPSPAFAGALFRDGQSVSLYGDRRALHVGDVITITLDERFQSSKQNGSKISKTTTAEIEQPTVLGSVLHQIASTAGAVAGLSSTNDFEGQADADQSNSLSGTLSVTVTQVMPNGLMEVRGEKWLTLNQGEEFVRLSGLVRPEDVGQDNRVSSTRLANARIAYSGRGAMADSSSMGWIARFFVSPIFPW